MIKEHGPDHPPSPDDLEALLRVGRDSMRKVYKRYQHDPDIDVVLGLARVGLRELAKGHQPERPPAESRDPFKLVSRMVGATGLSDA
jgi:hypothetical protein